VERFRGVFARNFVEASAAVGEIFDN